MDNSNLFQRISTDSKVEDPRALKNPTVRSLLQRLNVGSESVWIKIGVLRESIGDSTGAIEAYNNALRFSSNSAVPFCKLASILLRKGHLEQAFIYIQQALAFGNNSGGEVWSLLGYYYLKRGIYEQAYESFQNAIRLFGEQPCAFLWYGIGLLYELNGSTDYALEAYLNALRLKPYPEQTVDIYLHIAHIYEEHEALDTAFDFLNKAFLYTTSVNFHTSTPFLGEVYFRMGFIQELKRNLVSAKEFYLKALKENPNHAKSLQQLGWIEHEEGHSDEGFKLLKRAVEVDPNDGQGWYLLGRLHMAKKEYRSAYDNYQHAVYCNSRNPRFWCSIGVLYYQMGQHRDAMDAYTRAIRLNPNLSEVWYDLGTLYESFLQYKDALDAYKKALELSPNNAQIKARVLEVEKNVKDENAGLASRESVWIAENRSSIATMETKNLPSENERYSNMCLVRDEKNKANLEPCREQQTMDNPVPVSQHNYDENPIEEDISTDKNQSRSRNESNEYENVETSKDNKNDQVYSNSPNATASSSLNEEESEVESFPRTDSTVEMNVVEKREQQPILSTRNSSENERAEDETEENEHVTKRMRTRKTLNSSSESYSEEAQEQHSNEEKPATWTDQDTNVNLPEQKDTDAHSSEAKQLQ